MGFRPGGGMGNMNQIMKQAQKMQENMMRAKEEVEKKSVQASAGGGMVEVVVNGKMEVLELKINPEAVDPDDVEMLEDMVKAAVNEGIRNAQTMVEQEMAKVTGGFNIPGLF
ncbi:MAG: YbaB/EbfC family nucleoid-associated protein [Peptococcaceae bacterium]|jgi:DNA-binding YbaB/EbfC family protein|nr:YbaB/EbfC family nucleoid-associated protein [Peptococcaceae bacterium]